MAKQEKVDVKMETQESEETSSAPESPANPEQELSSKETAPETEPQPETALEPEVPEIAEAKPETAKKLAHEEAIPYERFKEVNDELKAMKQQMMKLNESQQASKPKTWDDLNIDELKTLKKHYASEGNSDMLDFVDDKIMERKAEEVSNRRDEKRQFSQTRVESWNSSVAEYKKLNDPAFDLTNENSELYKKTLNLVQTDSRFNTIAEGHALAAQLSAEQMLRDRLLKNQSTQQALKKKAVKSISTDALESGNRTGAPAAMSMDKMEKAAFAAGPYSREMRTYLRTLEDTKKKG